MVWTHLLSVTRRDHLVGPHPLQAPGLEGSDQEKCQLYSENVLLPSSPKDIPQ
jgi:hypothetical protein